MRPQSLITIFIAGLAAIAMTVGLFLPPIPPTTETQEPYIRGDNRNHILGGEICPGCAAEGIRVDRAGVRKDRCLRRCQTCGLEWVSAV